MPSQKTATVLNILANQYVQTANPVTSEDVVRLSATKVSSSIVRNAMSQLTEEGYISSPMFPSVGFPQTWATATIWRLWKRFRNCRPKKGAGYATA